MCNPHAASTCRADCKTNSGPSPQWGSEGHVKSQLANTKRVQVAGSFMWNHGWSQSTKTSSRTLGFQTAGNETLGSVRTLRGFMEGGHSGSHPPYGDSLRVVIQDHTHPTGIHGGWSFRITPTLRGFMEGGHSGSHPPIEQGTLHWLHYHFLPFMWNDCGNTLIKQY